MRLNSRFLDATPTVYFFFLIIYLFSLTSNFTGPHDSMTYLEMLKTREHLVEELVNRRQTKTLKALNGLFGQFA